MDARAITAIESAIGSASDESSGADPESFRLVGRAIRGDRAAFDGLYRRFAPLVHGVLISGLRIHEVDDAVQEVFLAAWRGLGALREHDHVGAWLATIARNRASRTRSRRGDATELPDAHPEDRGAGPVAHAENREILGVLRSLPEAYRETLALRLVEGMTGPEIAAATGLTHGSVRVNLTRGMKLLRDALSERGWP